MQIIQCLEKWQYIRKNIPSSASIGFVPTMGNLHAGHQSLYQKARKENDISIASLFINPTQFNQEEDFINYPQTLGEDLACLKSLEVDYCILPESKSLYHDHYQFQIHENSLSTPLEGEKRPGHFTGVMTVVMKLLNLVKPDRAYFGEKDYQQYLLIKEMVSAFFMDIEIIACPTIREPSGLAYSSRNNRLSSEQYLLANEFANNFHQPEEPLECIRQKLESLGITVEYIAEAFGRRFAAVVIGNIRLIDNYAIQAI